MVAGAQKRVLVIDDSRFVRTTFNRILSAWFAVREEADGEAGWEALRTDASIAMVFSDLDMPKLDGFGLIKRIRSSAEARIRGLPVVVISGSQDETSRRRAREAGANDFISKSADAPEVLARIGALMRLVTPAALTPQVLLAEANKHFSRARRQGTPLSVIALRVDSFADAAGKLGRQAADELLARVGRLIASMMRSEDSVARAGEATFVVVSPGTGTPQACAFALRLREQLHNAQVSYGGRALRIRASAGYASYGADDADSIEELMKRALQRLQSGPPRPSALPDEVERALKVLETLDAEGIGDAAAREIVRRLAPFMQRALKRAS